MAAKTKLAQKRLTLLQLAEKLGNVSKACRMHKVSRSQFYEYKRAFQEQGLDGLIDKPPIPGSHPNELDARSSSALSNCRWLIQPLASNALPISSILKASACARVLCATCGSKTVLKPVTSTCSGWMKTGVKVLPARGSAIRSLRQLTGSCVAIWPLKSAYIACATNCAVRCIWPFLNSTIWSKT